MTGQVPNDSVHTQVWDKIYSIINTIPDPGGKSKWIYSAFPEKLIDREDAYPLVVISPISVEYDPLTFKNLKEGPLRVTIDIYSRRADELDNLADQITNKMEDSDEAFTVSGISAMSLTSSNYAHFDRETLRIHNKTLVYEFNYGWF